ncbi:MAG: DUF3343 domain-containing protein [Clostridia bacterium]|nr:DUF3343 domain-containing protein [Clostridia bacterium]MBQ2669717.1 DUF3343 domain-containing protein [Clostridia bacterium]MBQ6530248.1 DUF3343 domain-containing protein [Clostridia bacterium]MBQ9599344.1 DUF3343 domain-containing protein [Clostridia bacterium]
MEMYIVVGSATTAERLKRRLEKVSGYPALVVRTPAPIRTGGCSYSVRIDDRTLDLAKQVLSTSGLSYKKIYRVMNRNGERVYNAVP